MYRLKLTFYERPCPLPMGLFSQARLRVQTYPFECESADRARTFTNVQRSKRRVHPLGSLQISPNIVYMKTLLDSRPRPIVLLSLPHTSHNLSPSSQSPFPPNPYFSYNPYLATSSLTSPISLDLFSSLIFAAHKAHRPQTPTSHTTPTSPAPLLLQP